MKIEITKDVELDAGLPVQRAYLSIDGTKLFGPLSSDEVTTLIGVMKKSVTPGWFSEQASVSGMRSAH
jgi:hypothetical protein